MTITRTTSFATLAVASLLALGLTACAPAEVEEPPPAPEATSEIETETPTDLGAACVDLPESLLDLQTASLQLGSEGTWADVTAAVTTSRDALAAAADAEVDSTFLAEQGAYLDSLDGIIAAEDNIALLTAVRDSPDFITPLAELCAGQPGW